MVGAKKCCCLWPVVEYYGKKYKISWCIHWQWRRCRTMLTSSIQVRVILFELLILLGRYFGREGKQNLVSLLWIFQRRIWGAEGVIFHLPGCEEVAKKMRSVSSVHVPHESILLHVIMWRWFYSSLLETSIFSLRLPVKEL